MKKNSQSIFCAEIYSWDEMETPFPFRLFNINDEFKIIKTREGKCLCIIFPEKDGNHESFYYDNLLTFISIYSLSSKSSISYNLMKKGEMSELGIDIDISIKNNIINNVTNASKQIDIESKLNEAKKIFSIYNEISQEKLKKHITNSLFFLLFLMHFFHNNNNVKN
jgi:hypothetical protein